MAYETIEPPLLHFRIWLRRRESRLASTRLQDERSFIQLSYAAKSLVELRGVEPLRPACKAGIMPLDHSPTFEVWSRRRDSNPHPLVYETNALVQLELLRNN